MTNRSCELDVVRCMMNYMIVLLHAWAAFQYVCRDTVEFKMWTFICSYLSWMAIPTFFLISGYLLFQKFSFATWPEKMRRRVRRLAVPYIVWNVAFVVFYLSLARIVPRLGTRVASFGLDTFAGAFSKVLSLTIAPIDGPLWFLRVLFLLTLVSPLLFIFLRVGRGMPLLVCSIFWCVGESALGWKETLRLVCPAYALVCFLAGGVLAVNGRDLAKSFAGKWRVWLIVGLLACVMKAGLSMSGMTDAAVVGVGTAMIWSIMVSLFAILQAPALIALTSRLNVEQIASNRIYQFLRQMSFFAYAGHFLFCSMWLHTVAPCLGGYWTGKFTVLILVFVGCGVPTMVAVYWIAKRLCPKVLRLFDGTL